MALCTVRVRKKKKYKIEIYKRNFHYHLPTAYILCPSQSVWSVEFFGGVAHVKYMTPSNCDDKHPGRKTTLIKVPIVFFHSRPVCLCMCFVQKVAVFHAERKNITQMDEFFSNKTTSYKISSGQPQKRAHLKEYAQGQTVRHRCNNTTSNYCCECAM